MNISISIKKGGAGSGHHGHAGRPGKVGGSLPGNGISAAASKDVDTDSSHYVEAKEGMAVSVGARVAYRSKSGKYMFGEVLSLDSQASGTIGWYKRNSPGVLGTQESRFDLRFAPGTYVHKDDAKDYTIAEVPADVQKLYKVVGGLRPKDVNYIEVTRKEMADALGNHKAANTAVGLYKSATNTIYILEGYRSNDPVEKSDIAKLGQVSLSGKPLVGATAAFGRDAVIVHELAHWWSRSYDNNPAWERLWKTYQKEIVKDPSKVISRYASTDEGELFAEATVAYVYANKWLRSTWPRIAKFIDKLKFETIEVKKESSSEDDWIEIATEDGEYIKIHGISITKGGEGSGHFDHVGRPGKVGGSMSSRQLSADFSAPSQRIMEEFMVDHELPYDDDYIVKVAGTMYKVRLEGWFQDCMESRNFGETCVDNIRDNYLQLMQDESGWHADIHGYIEDYLDTEFGMSYIGEKIDVHKGGEGSGHHGHAGRPGKRGGSLPGKGLNEHEAYVKEYLEKISTLRGNHAREGFAYSGYEQMYLEKGSFYKPPTSPKLPSGIRRGKMRQCYYNAATTAVPNKYFYTEGYALVEGIPFPIEHAWLTDKDGQVYDVTWADTRGVAYYGIAFSFGYLSQTMIDTGLAGIVVNDFENGYKILKEGLPDSAIASVTVMKGGEGSGHRGHDGRPGKVGGSVPGQGSISADDQNRISISGYERLSSWDDRVNGKQAIVFNDGSIAINNSKGYVYHTIIMAAHILQNPQEFDDAMLSKARKIIDEKIAENEPFERKFLNKTDAITIQGIAARPGGGRFQRGEIQFKFKNSLLNYNRFDPENVPKIERYLNDLLKKVQHIDKNGTIPLERFASILLLTGIPHTVSYSELQEIKRIKITENLDVIELKSISISIVKGGPGSGHWGHVGRPGKVGGSLAGVGGLRAIGDDTSNPNRKGKRNRTAAELTQRYRRQLAAEFRYTRNNADRLIAMWAEKLGYDPKKIVYAGTPYDFTVAGVKSQAAADYDPKTGIIRTFRTAFTSDMLAMHEGLLAHEIMHDRWHKLLRAYKDQSDEVAGAVAEAIDDGTYGSAGFFLNPDGTFRSQEDRDSYKAYIWMSSFIRDVTSGGVRERHERQQQYASYAAAFSSYAHSYWKEAMMAGGETYFQRAMNETMAEVHRFVVTGRKHEVPGLFYQFYQEIMEMSDADLGLF